MSMRTLICRWAYPAVLCVLVSLASSAVAAPQVPATEHADPGPLPTVSPQHPRLWFNADNLPRFRERWRDPAWAAVVSDIEAARGDKQPKNRAVAHALTYLATQDTAEAEAAITAAMEVLDQPMKLDYDNRFAGHADPAALVFDWCYDRLGDRKAVFVERLRARAAHWEEKTVGHFITHELYPYLMPYLSEVLALEGDVAPEASRLRPAYHLTLNWIAMMDEQAGEGDYRSYFYQLAYQFFPFLWDAASDSRLVERSRFLASLPTFLSYRLHPNGQSFVATPDDTETGKDGTIVREQSIGAGFVLMIASELDDPVAQWLGERVRQRAGLGLKLWNNKRDTHWLGMLYCDETQRSLSPAEAGLPLARAFSSCATSRSGWENSSGGADIAAWLYAGPLYSHMRQYQGHFDLWRGGDDLAIRGGNYYGSPAEYQAYANSSVSRNCISFVPVGSTAPDADGDQVDEKARDAAVDRERFPVNQRHGSQREVRSRGTITHVIDGEGYAVLSADLGRAYEQVSRYRRDLIHLRPGIVLVHDVYKAATPLETVRWVLHTRERPELPGASVVEGTDAAGILEATGAERFTATRGESRLDATVLAPAPSKLRAIGGHGYEDYVDGKNYDPLLTKQGGQTEKVHPSYQRRMEYSRDQWRTEVYTPVNEGVNQILVALQARPRDAAAEATFESRATDQGIVVDVTAGEARWRVTLPRHDAAPTVEMRQ